MTVNDLLKAMIAQRASDIHIHAGAPPYMRIDGELVPFNLRPLTPADTEMITNSFLNDRQRELFLQRNELDFAYTIPGVARFRANIFRQRGSVGAVLRVVSETVPGFEPLGLPADVMKHIAQQERGLVIVTGPTGSGKSTTLGALIHYINENYAYNVITIEDPIEFLHKNRKSLVIQREIGLDTSGFHEALRYCMRQDPDVIMIGEMRDKETISAAITAAQTGHLVLTTLHTLDAIRTINRMIDFFPPHERQQIRILLADSLVGILSQRLIPRKDGGGRALALEVLVATPLIKEYVRDEQKTNLIKDAMAEDNLRGMRTFDQHLVGLYGEGTISLEDATSAATSPHEFKLMLTKLQGGAGVSSSSGGNGDVVTKPVATRDPRMAKG
jgi:twitching motility protein PilT